MAREHHQFNAHEFEQTLGDSGRQKSLEYYSSWGHRIRHDLATEQQRNDIWDTVLLTNVMGYKIYWLSSQSLRIRIILEKWFLLVRS